MNSFRIDASELAAWHQGLAARLDVRGVAAIAKEVEAHLARKDADGSVVVTRHQLFTWAEALQGAAARDPRGTSAGSALSLAQIVEDMRSILTGKPPGGAPVAAAPAVVTAPVPAPYASAPVAYAPPPAVVYGSAPAAVHATGGAVRVVHGNDVATAVRDLLRSARQEVCVISPWDTGIETIVADLVALPPDVRVLMVSRRPTQESPAYHQALDKLGRRKAVTAFSPHIQTRLVVVDGERALVGAAGVPGPTSREMGIVIADRGAAAAVRAHFERVHAEAAGPR